MKKIIIISCVVLIAILFGVYTHINSSPLSKEGSILFEIKPGSAFYTVAGQLSRKKLIRSITFFKLMGKLRSAASKIKAGFYHINKSHSATDILSLFLSGKVHTVRVTIPEGKDNKHIARILAAKHLVDEKEFLKIAGNGKMLEKIGFMNYRTAEGFLFPDTYHIPWGASAKSIVNMMIQSFKRRVGKNLIEKMKRTRIGFYKTLILASIVEREAVKRDEKSKIAGVFLNRLRIGMKFESCATIQYILGEVKKKLFYYQLKIPSPYNTYINRGFPPAPIANPGLGSIRAAASPDKHRYLYFVAKPDGSHYFSRSGREHNRAARRYQWKNK